MFDNFAPDAVKNNPKARTEWAVDQVKKAGVASRRLGITAHATFSGSLLLALLASMATTTQRTRCTWF